MTTKFRITSDLHLDHYAVYSEKTHLSYRETSHAKILKQTVDDANQTLIIAGDIATQKYLNDEKIALIRVLSDRFKNVLIVLGNHDFWSELEYSEVLKFYRNAFKDLKNVSILENDTIIIDDVYIFGATYWTNFYESETQRINARIGMMDYRLMPGNQTPDFIYNKNKESYEALHRFCYDNRDKKRLIITHHIPCDRQIAQEYMRSPVNGAFSNGYYEPDFSDVFFDPDLWISGHIHNSTDYMVGEKTRIITNPYGYPLENAIYNNNFVVEL